MKYYKFDELQNKINQEYYKSNVDIYSDFKTFVDCSKISEADAIEFYNFIKKKWNGEEINIYDMGVGNGSYSLNFLKKMEKLDPELTKLINYRLCDISFRISEKNEKGMEKFNVYKQYVDAVANKNFIKNADYVRSNEMFDDLPSKVYVKKEDVIFEVYYNEQYERKYVEIELSKKDKEFMDLMPEGYEIPINTGCLTCMLNVLEGLKKDSYFTFNDYGFIDTYEIMEMGPEFYNMANIRTYGGQPTIDVNFMYLEYEMKRKGIKSVVENQRKYVEKILGNTLYYFELDQLDYLEEAEIKTRKKELEKHGYSVDDVKNGVLEFDDYKYMKIIKN